MSGERLVFDQYPPKGFVLLDCGHVVRKIAPRIHTDHGEACSEFCAQSLEKNPPSDPIELLREIARNPKGGAA